MIGKSTVLAVCLLTFCASAQLKKIGDVVMVRDGMIVPEGYVSSVSNLVSSVAVVQAGIATAQATQAAALMISNELAIIKEMESARNATGYIRGFVESFSAGIVADTNMTASIITLEPGGSDETSAYWDLYTFFSEDPGVFPVVTTSESTGRTNAWDLAESVGVSLTTKVVGSIEYECYKNRVAMPLDTLTAFFRVQADVVGVGTNQPFFPVDGGIAVNGKPGVTITIIDGDTIISYKGGVRVQ